MSEREDFSRDIAHDRAAEQALGIVRPVGEESVAIITRRHATEVEANYTGNVLRRICNLGGAACQEVCDTQRRDYDIGAYGNRGTLCADANLAYGINALGMNPGDVLMVSVTGNEVGFGDQLGHYLDEGRLKANPDGWRELPGFNAFFARANEVPAIGSRLADCAHFEFEFKDRDGNTVIGFEHGTRPNMYGEGKHAFEVDGQPVSYTEYVVAQAVEHYGADPASFNIRLSASISPQNFVKRFDSIENMERHIPGWYDAGFVTNVTNPDWQPGDPMLQTDEWHADARGMILHDIGRAMQTQGIPEANFVCDDMLDPADTGGEFSSYENRRTFGDSRDLYLVAHHTAFKAGE